MNSSSKPSFANGGSDGKPTNIIEQVVFEFQDLEITWNTMVLRFFGEKTVIPLNDIESYNLKWYLYDDRTIAKKYWFLILTVHLKNAEQQSGPVATAKFNCLSDEHDLRDDIEESVARAISLALCGPRMLRKK